MVLKSERCVGCPAYSAPGPVPSELNGVVGFDVKGSTDVVFVGEAPGNWEVAYGRPFANPTGAGGLLRQCLEQIGIRRFGLLNVWKCVCKDVFGVHSVCADALKDELARISCKVVVTLGSVALREVAGFPDVNVMQVRGRLFSVNGMKVLSLLHPAFLLRSPGYWREWELGLLKLKRVLEGRSDYIPTEMREVTHCTTQESAIRALDVLERFSTYACDVETASFNAPWQNGELLTVSIAYAKDKAFAFDVGVLKGEVFERMKRLFEDTSRTWIWYNGIFDIQFFHALGINARIDRDAMLEAHLLDERDAVHSLKRDCAVLLDQRDWEADLGELDIPNDTSERAQQMWREIPREKLLEYNGQDAMHTFHLSELVRELLEPCCVRYADTLLAPTYNMLADARRVGLCVDLERVKQLMGRIRPVLDEITARLVEYSGDKYFNPNSHVQRKALLRKCGLNVEDTRRETLAKYVESSEVVRALMEYAEAHKIFSTYVEGIVDDIASDGRVHPDWKLPAVTGRLRCSNPNLLGIPRKAEVQEHKWKRYVKEQFVSAPGHLFVHIDRKQSEVRCACFLAGDEKLSGILKSGRDLHSEVARLMYGEGFTKEQRVAAKMIVFGLIYNRGAGSLSQQMGVTVEEAKDMMDKFFSQMPRLMVWRREVIRESKSKGYLQSYFGRIRHFGLITRDNCVTVENESVNFPISALSNELNLLCCVETHKRFGKYGVQVLVPIHDAALIQLPVQGHESLVSEISGFWESYVPELLGTDLPFGVDVTVGERWSEL